MTVLLDDDAVSAPSERQVVGWMREAVLAAHRGTLLAPPRVQVRLDPGRLMITAGRVPGDWYGYRSYDVGLAGGQQVVVVHDDHDGRVRAVVVGERIGPRRVGGIGGVAADALALPDASVLAVIGSGTQAAAQVRAIAAVRPLREVRVFSRNPAGRARFAESATRALGIPVRPVDTAADAVPGAELVVLATSSAVPVLDAGLLSPGAFVTTLGPKQVGRAEFGPDLVAAADVAVTDSVAQLDAYDPPNVLAGTAQRRRLRSLGAVLAGDAPGRCDPTEIVLFCSVGLAGTEAYLAARVAAGHQPP